MPRTKSKPARKKTTRRGPAKRVTKATKKGAGRVRKAASRTVSRAKRTVKRSR